MWFGALLFSLLLMVGCSSSEGYRMPESDLDSTARPEAFAGDMAIRKVMPDRRGQKPWEFYYKHCSVNGNEVFYSKTSYDCNGPY